MVNSKIKGYVKEYVIEKNRLNLAKLYDEIEFGRKGQILLVELVEVENTIQVAIQNLDDADWEATVIINILNNIPPTLLEALMAAKAKALENEENQILILNTVLNETGRTLCLVNATKEHFVNFYKEKREELLEYEKTIKAKENN